MLLVSKMQLLLGAGMWQEVEVKELHTCGFAQKMAQRPASASSAAADSLNSDKLVGFLFRGFWCSKQG